MTPAARVLLVVLLLAVFLGGGFLLFRTLKKKKAEGTLFLLPNGDGTYRVEERSEKETYQNGRKERMSTQTEKIDPEPIHIRTDITVYEMMKQGIDANDPCSDEVPCRQVHFNSNSDIVWYLEKIHQDTKAVSIEFLETIPEFVEQFGDIQLVHENPLTVGDGTHEIVVGKDLSLLDGYLATLFLYKKLGRPLPQPDPSMDYREI